MVAPRIWQGCLAGSTHSIHHSEDGVGDQLRLIVMHHVAAVGVLNPRPTGDERAANCGKTGSAVWPSPTVRHSSTPARCPGMMSTGYPVPAHSRYIRRPPTSSVPAIGSAGASDDTVSPVPWWEAAQAMRPSAEASENSAHA